MLQIPHQILQRKIDKNVTAPYHKSSKSLWSRIQTLKKVLVPSIELVKNVVVPFEIGAKKSMSRMVKHYAEGTIKQ